MTESPTPRTEPRVSVVLLCAEGVDAAPTWESLATQGAVLDDVEILPAGVPGACDIPRDLGPSVRPMGTHTTDVGEALTLALDAARGSYVTILAAGDRVSPHYLQDLASAASPDRLAVADIGVGQVGRGFPVGQAGHILASGRGTVIPISWCVDVRLPPGLGPGWGAALHGAILAPFSRRFGVLDTGPAERGAILTLVDRPATTSTFATMVDGPLAVAAFLCTGTQHDPVERAPLTHALVAAQLATVSAYRLAHPEEESRVRHAVAATGVPGLGLTAPGGWTWPDLDVLLGAEPPTKPRVLLVAGNTDRANALVHELALLRASGTALDLLHLSGAVDVGLKNLPRHRLRAAQNNRPASAKPARTLTQRARRKASRYWSAAVSKVQSTPLHPRPAHAPTPTLDQASRDLIARADLVIALDGAGAGLARAGGVNPASSVAIHSLVLAATATSTSWGTSELRAVRAATRALAELPAGDLLTPPPAVLAVAAWRLYRAFRIEAARTLADAALRIHPDAHVEYGFDLFAGMADLARGDALSDRHLGVVGSVVKAADAALAAGEHERAAFLMGLVAETLFHPDVQSNVAHPPLLADRERLLAPLAGSRVWSLLSSPMPSVSAPGNARSGSRPRVLVLPGSYPRFAAPVTEALTHSAEVQVLRLAQLQPGMGAMAASPRPIHERLCRSLGLPVASGGTMAAAFRDRDVIFADWADKGALLASLLAPPGCRLVIRCHGVDTLSLWQYLIDWSRVTDVIFVSDHLRRTVNDNLGERLAHVRQHVVGNVVDLGRFAADSAPGASRTLGMVGWGQKVKDPLWTLELLAALRKVDPAWRLVLVGRDFPPTARRASEQAYAEAFRARVVQPDIVDAVEYVGQSRDLPRHLRRIGFAISSSFRESFHIGAVEMVAAGAVPVFRDWPAYSDMGGVRGLFPDDWVVGSVDEAVTRILSLAGPDAWAEASAAARGEVGVRFATDTTADLYRQIILGS